MIGLHDQGTGQTRATPAPLAGRPRMVWWRAALFAFIALAVGGIVPIALGGELLGIWHIQVPFGLPAVPATPTAPTTPAKTPTKSATPRKGYAGPHVVWIVTPDSPPSM